MRIKLGIDAYIAHQYLAGDEYPTLRQILDEIYNAGNAEIFIFSEDEYADTLIIEQNLEEIANSIPNTRHINAQEFDIIADVRKNYLHANTSIDITDGFKPLIRWFCPSSKLLDNEWCLINSGDFIGDVHNTLNELERLGIDKIKTIAGEIVNAEYLQVEKIFISLYKMMGENSLTVRCNDFFVTRKEEELYFGYGDADG